MLGLALVPVGNAQLQENGCMHTYMYMDICTCVSMHLFECTVVHICCM